MSRKSPPAWAKRWRGPGPAPHQTRASTPDWRSCAVAKP